MSDETKVILTGVRFAFVHVFKAYAYEEGGEEKYSVTVIIDKKDKKNLNKIEDAVEAAIAAGKVKPGKSFKFPLRDGDEDKEDDENFAGCMFFTASTKRKPQVVDENLDPILDADDFYSGCYGNVSVNFYAYDRKSKGVAAGLQNIQKTDDGERLAGGSTAAQDFGAVSPGAKKAKRKDDEEEAPRRRSRRDEDDEEEAPRRRSRRDEDDEEEERPRRRSRRDEDDEEEERPRRRSRRDEDDEEEERPRRRR